MEIGNEDNTFVINPHGMSVYDSNSSQSERIFIGIENGQATFRLMSRDGSNKLVLSEDGFIKYSLSKLGIHLIIKIHSRLTSTYLQVYNV